MKVEVRADGVHISGYVNATGKKSRPVRKPDGTRCVEVIEERVFAEAIQRAGNITVTVDHDDTHVYAETSNGTLKLKEDAIGLHADVLISDPQIITLAKSGKIKGWSFGMRNVQDSMEARADDLPIRHVMKMDMDHITLVVKKIPCYAATSVEIRASDGTEAELELRGDIIAELVAPAQQENTVNYTEFDNRIAQLRAV